MIVHYVNTTGGAGGCKPWMKEENLDRALVAGLMLEVVLNHPQLPEDPWIRRCQVKKRLKTTLVSHLAGHIPLDSFRALAQNLDHWFDSYYPLISPNGPISTYFQNPGEPRPPSFQQTLREELLAKAVGNLNGLLPTRRHRKLDRQKLLDFLRLTNANWFRLKDFEGFFRIDRKTAWEYVQKLLQAGLLSHNQARSAAVRYRLAPRFLIQGSGASAQRSESSMESKATF